MRLLVITNDFPPTVGGIENYIYSLVRRWPPGDVVVVTRRVPGDDEFDAAQGFEILREDSSVLLPTPGLVRRMMRLAADRRIDVVHFPSTLPLGLMAAGLGLPYALSVHGGEFVLASRIPAVRSVLRAVTRQAAAVLPESSFASSLVTGLIGPHPGVTLVTCGVDADRYAGTEPASIGAGGPVVVSVSRLVARKGARTLVEAFPRVLARHPAAHLLIVGGGPDLELLGKMARSKGIDDWVTLTGPQPWERVPSFLAAADVFALPTRSRFFGTETEGLPLVYVEAAAAGLPLIGADVGGVKDAVRPGETGILVDGASPEDTTDAIIRLLDDPQEAARLGKAAREMALREFSWDAVYERYREALVAVAANA